MFKLPSNLVKTSASKLSQILLTSVCAAIAPAAIAQPLLNFSDLISGPDVGIGDGLGSGAIVTIWGQNLGSSQGDSTIQFCDSSSQCRSGHVYYWKNADGELPSGPANLYESHRMQEIAFSIPDSAMGAGEIRVTTSEGQSSLPFTVRSGEIFHVRSNGNDSSGNGSFSSAWRSAEVAIQKAARPGVLLYFHDVDSGEPGDLRGIYWRYASSLSELDNQYGIIAYPGVRPTATGVRGVEVYKGAGLVLSKMDVYSSSHNSVDANGQPSGRIDRTTFGIKTSRNGRVVANRLTDIPGWCASGSSGGITGNSLYADYASNAKIYGNEIYEYGCEGSSKLHHTAYMSVRSGPNDEQLVAWEFGWNYLHDNDAKNGIHQFDQNENCGDLTTPLLIHNNVVTNQAGSGISIGLSGCNAVWNTKIYNNILINNGLAAAWDGRDVNSSDGPDTGAISIWHSGFIGTAEIYNNTVYKWNDDDMERNTRACFGFTGGSRDTVSVSFTNNVCLNDKPLNFIGDSSNGNGLDDDVVSGGNVFYSSALTSLDLGDTPVGEGDIFADPQMTIQGPIVSLAETSPVLGKVSTDLTYDIYGNIRGANAAAGAVELYSAPIVIAPPSKPLPPPSFNVRLN